MLKRMLVKVLKRMLVKATAACGDCSLGKVPHPRTDYSSHHQQTFLVQILWWVCPTATNIAVGAVAAAIVQWGIDSWWQKT